MKIVAVFALLCAAGSCDTPFELPPQVATIQVTPDTVSLRTGDSAQLSAQALDSSGHPVPGVSFTWNSSSNSIATVSSRGLVRSILPGVVTVAASAQAVKGQARVAVAPRIVQVHLDQTAIITVPGAAVPFTVFELDAQGDTLRGRPISWSSADTTVFTVSNAGVIHAWAPGVAQLTAVLDTIRGTASVRVVTAAFVTISAGEADHTCALTVDSLALCWGTNDLGQLSVPALPLSTAPVTAPYGLTFIAVHPGATFTCGEVLDDNPYCWGSNFLGRLGVGATTTGSIAPRRVSSANLLHGLTTGWNDTCGLNGTQTYCWGEDPGAGGSEATRFVPTQLSADSTFSLMDASVGFVCALTAGGTPLCWGVNALGQLGNGTQNPATSPVPVAGGHQFIAVGGGSGHACGLTAAGAAYCWGLNSSGQLGTGDTASSLSPVPVVTAVTFQALDAGGTQTCGLATDSTAWCWGGGVTAPAAVSGGLRFRTLSVGDRHVCGIAADGRAYCWGANEHGQLGDGTLTERSAPTRVLGQP